MRIGILGLGLIGGSVARALRARRPTWQLAAWSPSGDGPRRAVDDGVLDTATADPGDAIAGADLVLIAAPPLATLDLLDELAGPLHERLGDEAVITDVASTKRAIVARAAVLGLRFVGGHPMAGSEATGYDAADGDLFVDRPWVIAPSDAGGNGRVEELAAATGATPVPMDAAAHDAAVAVISHLPLVLSAALVEAVTGGSEAAWTDARRLAAGGWRDMTRLAKGDIEMGAGILATNADHVSEGLRRVRAVVDEWLALVDADEPDVDAIRARLAAARTGARPVDGS